MAISFFYEHNHLVRQRGTAVLRLLPSGLYQNPNPQAPPWPSPSRGLSLRSLWALTWPAGSMNVNAQWKELRVQTHTYTHTDSCNYIHMLLYFYGLRWQCERTAYTNTNTHIHIQYKQHTVPEGRHSHTQSCTCRQTHTLKHSLAIWKEITQMADSLSMSCRQPRAQQRSMLVERWRDWRSRRRRDWERGLLHLPLCHPHDSLGLCLPPSSFLFHFFSSSSSLSSSPYPPLLHSLRFIPTAKANAWLSPPHLSSHFLHSSCLVA